MSRKDKQAAEQRAQALGMLGRYLARRSRSSCELCGAKGVPLRPVEVTPPPEAPELDEAVFLCEPCVSGVRGERAGRSWRFLEEAVWTETRPAQVLAVRLLEDLGRVDGEAWANDCVAGLYLDDEVAARVAGRG